jgi:carboxymethylenebutenolidase
VTPLEDLANTRIPGPSPGIEILSYVATPSSSSSFVGNNKNPKDDPALPVLILIHEFFGLSPSIVEKAQALADDLGCIVVAPDTFRGAVTDFIPKAIWLALTTPTERVNDDLDAIVSYLDQAGTQLKLQSSSSVKVKADISKLAIMGFCYGGGKAIRYTTQRRPDAATVIFYGKPVTEGSELQKLKAPVCGIYGSNDVQFPMALLDQFQQALTNHTANVENDVRIYNGMGHAFWSDMEQVRRGDPPQVAEAYQQCTDFLRRFFFEGEDEEAAVAASSATKP